MQRSVQLPLPDHEMNHNQRLEHHRPCRFSNSNMQRSEDLCYACFAGMRRNKDILDIFRFRGRQLSDINQQSKTLWPGERAIQLTLTFVAPFTDFSKLDILSFSHSPVLFSFLRAQVGPRWVRRQRFSRKGKEKEMLLTARIAELNQSWYGLKKHPSFMRVASLGHG